MKFNNILEAITRDRVVRDGKWKIKYSSDKDGYKIVNKNGVRHEVRISPEEMRKRKRAAKRAARKRKAMKSKISAKRKRSMAKRG